MKRLIATAFVLGLLMPLCFGQTGVSSISPTSTTGHITGASSGFPTTSAIGTATIGTGITLNGAGDVIYWLPANATWNGIPFETRHRKLGAPTITDLHKTALHITRRDLAPVAYLKLAHDIGVPADEAQILEAIEHNSLEVFDYEKVDSYLYNQALKQGAKVRWVWKPAREKDIETLQKSGVSSGERENTGFVYEKLYAKRIPMEVMATIKAVLECAPDAIPLISDF